MGETGSTAHLFYNCGVIHISKKKLNEEEIFEIATNSGAMDCFNLKNYHEIISDKENFYKVKNEFDKRFDKLEYSGIEWRPINYLNLNENEQINQVVKILEALDQFDDVQNVFTNVNLENVKL